ncbi:MAG: carboxymuconolactone decarboxylase family protein [Acidimicrobiia bacterium]
MVRVPYIDVETLDPIPVDPSPYDPDWISTHNIHRAMANHPEALRVFWPRIGTWIRGKSSLEPRLRELAIIQASYITASGYEFSHHVHYAEQVGVTHEEVLAIIAETNGEKSTLSELERNVLKAARDLTVDLQIDDATWSFLEEQLGHVPLIELVLVTSYYNHIIRLVAALQIGVDGGEEGEAALASYLERYPPPHQIGRWR